MKERDRQTERQICHQSVSMHENRQGILKIGNKAYCTSQEGRVRKPNFTVILKAIGLSKGLSVFYSFEKA